LIVSSIQELKTERSHHCTFIVSKSIQSKNSKL
jgi:hypothetical protein